MNDMNPPRFANEFVHVIVEICALPRYSVAVTVRVPEVFVIT
jgi:hypothetical protein